MKLTIKIGILLVVAIVALLLIMTVRRLYFLFDSKKVKTYAEQAANETGAPNIAYRFIIEQTESILKSQDLTQCVLILAETDNVEKEKALVLTALNQCYSNGFIEKPAPIAPTGEEGKPPEIQ